MFRSIVAGMLIVALLAPPLLATPVEIVQIVIAGGFGAKAAYTVSDQTLRWTDGVAGFLLDTAGNAYEFDQVAVAAACTGMTDQSAGGQARASFSSDNWSLSMIDSVTGMSATLAGTLYPGAKWVEEETAANSDVLAGKGFVSVTTAAFNGLTAQWGDDNNKAGLQSTMPLSYGFNLAEFLTQDFGSENVTIFLFADETLIPEPLTMLLLGVGAVGVMRRRRAH